MRDFLVVQWLFSVVNISLVCGFFFLIEFMDFTDGEIMGWIEIFGRLRFRLCYCFQIEVFFFCDRK